MPNSNGEILAHCVSSNSYRFDAIARSVQITELYESAITPFGNPECRSAPVRDDEIGVVNGSTATVVKISESAEFVGKGSRLSIEADIGNWRVTFDPMRLADAQGRPRLGWAYASTIYGAQGLTVDHAVVYLDQAYNRHDIYVAASRARARTTLVVDARSIDRRLATELPLDQQYDDFVFAEGATPPLGNKIVEAERRGQKIKKKLAVDLVETETVSLIFRLYLEGDGVTGPLGVKETTKWLNAHGHRTRRGSTFGVGPVHNILTNGCYASGLWPYGKRNSRDGGMHDPSNVIDIPVPILIEQGDFDRVQVKLA